MKFITITDEQNNDPVLIENVAYVFLGEYSKVITEEELDYIDSSVQDVLNSKDTESFVQVTNEAFDKVTGNPDVSIPGHVYFIRSLTNNKIALTFVDFPELKDWLNNYAELSKAARLRSYKIERGE